MKKEVERILEDIKNNEVSPNELTYNEIKLLIDYINNIHEKMKIDLDLLRNYEFDKYNWNYFEQQAVAEYISKELKKGGYYVRTRN